MHYHRSSLAAVSTDLIQSLMRELAAEGLRTASACEPGWYWRASDGQQYWVTTRETK